MRIGPMLGALLGVERLDQALADCALRGWPCLLHPLPRERALELGRVDLAGAPSASVGHPGALILVEGAAGPRWPGGWQELTTTDCGAPSGALLACESPLQALGWYRGLGLAGVAQRAADGSVTVELPCAQWLRFIDRAAVPTVPGWRLLVVCFARTGALGQRSQGLRPRVLAGPEGETIALL